MLLQSLYEFARRTKASHGGTLLETPEFEGRFVPWLIDLTGNGDLKGFIPLMTDETPGFFYAKLPRTLEAKDSGTVADFLVEDMRIVLSLGESPAVPIKDKARQKHESFWGRIQAANAAIKHPALSVILSWRRNALAQNAVPKVLFEAYQKPGSRGASKEQWLLLTPASEKKPLFWKPNAGTDATFRVDGQVVVLDDAILDWWKAWFREWLASRENACRKAHGGRVCAVTGEHDAPISNSHLPKIRGVPNTSTFGATLASAEADSYHSYNLSVQRVRIPDARNAPDASYTNVSVRGAIAYCDALNFLLTSKDHHLWIKPVVFCFWCKSSESIPRHICSVLGKTHPEQVRKLLRSQFTGVEPPEVLRKERLHSVSLAGNAGRIMVRQWIDQTLDEAVANLNKWWDHLQIAPLYNLGDSDSSPYSVRNLAEATVRRSKKRDEDPVGDRIVQLYTAALRHASLPLSLLKPILDEFQSALVKNDDPFNQSRFALIKLILIRNKPKGKEGAFMPTYELADTPDSAYNLGRLLAVFENLQYHYHGGKLKGAGVVERYYGTASSAPSIAFPLLCRLARHHLSKLKKGDEDEKKVAGGIEKRIGEILCKFQAPEPGKPPSFPRILSLEEQGRFALGFYQQKAFRPPKTGNTDANKESKEEGTDEQSN